MTNEQIEQFRDAMSAWLSGRQIQVQYDGKGDWDDWVLVVGPDFNDGNLYRPKPVPKTRPWSKPEDVPGPVCWMRYRRSDGGCMLVIGLEPEGLQGLVVGGKVSVLTWRETCGWEYSTDRVTWKKCEVTE